MIQDIKPHVFHNEYNPTKPQEDDIVFIFKGRTLLLKDNDLLEAPLYKDVSGDVQYLFSMDGISCFLAEDQEIEGYVYKNVQVLKQADPKEFCFAAETAYHLYNWYEKTKYCGHCGSTLRKSKIERAMFCPECGNIVYPTIAPAIIVGVVHEDAILMTRYANRAYKGHALIAGFMEIGETPEDTVKREVMEEVGLKVKNIRYYKSQPWGFDSNVLFGFFANLDGDDTISLEEDELAKARFIKRDEIEDEPDHLSLTRNMILAFKNEKYPK